MKLTLINRPTAVKADGADMVLVRIAEAVSMPRTTLSNVHPIVDFALSGPAEWRGGISQGKDNCILSTTLPAECGVNRALIRTAQAGKVTVSAASED